MKKCNICNKEKPLDQFGKNSKRYMPYCKSCYWIKYGRPDYERKKEKYLAAQAARRKAVKDWFTEVRKTLKCTKCDEQRYWCLDFHHSNNDKEANVSKLVADGFKVKAEEEMKKCVVLCKNCHADEHYQIRSGSTSGSARPS